MAPGLVDDFYVFVELEGGDFQVDFLVFKRNAIFNIEAKNWQVRRAYLDGDWELLDGRQLPSPIVQAREQCDRVASYLLLQRDRFLPREKADMFLDKKGDFKIFPIVAISHSRSPSSVPAHPYFKILVRGDQVRRHIDRFEWEVDTPPVDRCLVIEKKEILALVDLLKLQRIDPETLLPTASKPNVDVSETTSPIATTPAATIPTVTDSPYQYTYTVGGDAFYGRDRELDRIRRALVSEPPRPVAIQGLQRTGKSSLALECIARLVSGNDSYIVLLFDFRRLWQEGLKQDEDVTKELLTQLATTRNDPGTERVLDAYKDIETSGVIIDQRRLFVEALAEQRRRKKDVVLFLDECQDIADGLDEPKHKTFFSFIESLCKNESLGLRIVLACRPSFFELQPIRHINLGRLFETVTLGPLEEVAAKPVVDRGDPWLHFTDEAKAQILFLTGRHPFWLQFLCHRIFERWVVERTGEVNRRFVDETFAQIVKDPGCRPQFYLLYQEIEGNQSAFSLLQQLAESVNEEGGSILASSLPGPWADKAVLRTALKPLVDNQIIAVEDVPQAPALRFRVEALRRWMRPNLITL